MEEIPVGLQEAFRWISSASSQSFRSLPVSRERWHCGSFHHAFAFDKVWYASKLSTT
jgi:hypothetical protein